MEENKDYISEEVELMRESGVSLIEIIEYLIDKYNNAMKIIHTMIESIG